MYPLLRNELLRRAQTCHDARPGCQPTVIAQQTPSVSDNAAWLCQTVETHGWPGIRMVGTDGAHAAAVLAQHSPVEQRPRWLALLRDAVGARDAHEADLAVLIDIVRVDSGLPQLYGTQWSGQDNHRRLLPVTDPRTLNARRITRGLPALSKDQILRGLGDGHPETRPTDSDTVQGG
jgi:hypothetical protein